MVKEGPAFNVMNLVNDAVITHDDRLLIRAQKHEIGLTENWRSNTGIKLENGQGVIVNYGRTVNGEFQGISIGEYETLPLWEKTSYRPQFERGLEISEGITLSLKNNQFDLRICSLFDDWRSRYRIALEQMEELISRGVLSYTPLIEEPNQRNKREAIRHRLKKYGKPTEYEFDVMLSPGIGPQVFNDLSKHGDVVGSSTVYLQGKNVHKGITKVKIKAYDVDVREGLPSAGRYKIELTFLKTFFKETRISIAELTEQPIIQELLKVHIVKYLVRVLNLLTDEVFFMIAYAVGVNSKDRTRATQTVAYNLLGTERTLSQRVTILERDVAEMKRDIEELKRINK